MISIETEIDGQRFKIAVRDSRQAVSFFKGMTAPGTNFPQPTPLDRISTEARKSEYVTKKTKGIIEIFGGKGVESVSASDKAKQKGGN